MTFRKFRLAFILVVVIFVSSASPKDQYVEPLLFGMKVNIPYDMANLFNRFPFQGGIAIILGISLMCILFFGVITSPFGYMFGVPSEKYVMGDFKLQHPEVAAATRRIITVDQPPIISPRSSFLLDHVRSERPSPRTIFSDQRNEPEDQCCQTFLYYFDLIVSYLDYWEPGFLQEWEAQLNFLRNRLATKMGREIVNTVETSLNSKYTPEFISSMFYLIPEKEDIRSDACQLRIVCHAHGALQYLPVALLKIYQKFSTKLTKIPGAYVEAMRIGMINESLCSESFSGCHDNVFTLTLKSYLSLLPDKTQINGMPRRKQDMYMHFNK